MLLGIYMDRVRTIEASLDRIQGILDEEVGMPGRLDRLLVAAAQLHVISQEDVE